VRFLVDRPVLALVFFAAVLLLGAYSILNTPVELVPNETLPALSVSLSWGGATADMVMQRLALPVEEVVNSIAGVKRVSSRCQENGGTVQVEFDPHCDMNFVYVLLRERLNQLRGQLPPQAGLPQVAPYVPDEFRRRAFFSLNVTGDASVHTVRNQVDRDLLPALRSLAGVEQISVWGGTEPQLRVRIDGAALNRYRLSPAAIGSALGDAFYFLPSPTVTDRGKEVRLLVSRSAANLGDIDQVVLRPGNPPLRLRDVAVVEMGFREIEAEGRLNGLPTVVVDVYKQPQASSLALSRLIRDRIARIKSSRHGRLSLTVISDESEELQRRLLGLGWIALLILLIVFVILLAILRDVRAALIVFASVFFSAFAAFIPIYLFRIPLNLLTLSGFALGFGMFVDNAVVVYDNILRLRQKGMEPRRAAREGPRQVLLPVLASTLTTVVVFFSFAWFQGRLRVYYLPLAWTIAVALLSSVVVAYTLVPPMAARLELRLRPEKPAAGRRPFRFLLRYPLFVLLPSVLLLIFSYGLFRKEVSFGRFFSWYQRQTLDVWLRLPEGATFADTKTAILGFERAALAKPYLKQVKTRINGNQAQMEVSFPRPVELSAQPYVLKQELISLATNIAGAGISVSGFDPEGYYYSPSTGSYLPYSIQLRGYDFDRLLELAGGLKHTLLMHRRIQEVGVETDNGYYGSGDNRYFLLRVDLESLRRYGLRPSDLASLLPALLTSRSGGGRMRIGDGEYATELRLSGSESVDLEELLGREFVAPGGQSFRLRDVAALEERSVRGGVARENQEYQAYVRWDYLGSAKAADRVQNAAFRLLTLPPGFSKSLDQPTWRMSGAEESQLKSAMLLSLLLIFLVLAILYGSLGQAMLILLSLPLALIGVFLAFVWSGFAFDSTAYIGLILLSGVVVNNAIILVSHVNYYRDQGLPPREAISAGASERIRPIFITTATTVLASLPLVLFREGGQNDIWSSLALCMVGGLTSSALLIPFVIPVLYHLQVRLQQHWKR
jgi:hydrophobic/amphiphilic exporter-1 (mainly G- bacteria), HAE1 family